MAQTVAQGLTAATDSVTLINKINDGSMDLVLASMTQAKINEIVQRNVDHLTTILSYDSSMEGVPNVAGDSSDKSSYTDAIATGNTYITDNS